MNVFWIILAWREEGYRALIFHPLNAILSLPMLVFFGVVETY